MDFFSGKNPDLIGPAMKSSLHEIMNKPKAINATVSDKVTITLYNFWNDYIYEYKFIIICIILIITFFIFRYYNKNKIEKFENKKCPKPKYDKNDPDVDLFKEIENYNFHYDGHLYMNPLESIDKQENKTEVLYPADPLPVNISNDKKIFTRNLYDDPLPDKPLNAANYDYDGVYKNASRSYYSGLYDTYKDAEDTIIENPYDWSNKFNTTTGKFVGQMTDRNLQAVKDYQTIIDNTEYNLVNGANNRNNIDSMFEKPYEE